MRARCANKGEKVGVMQVAKSFVRVARGIILARNLLRQDKDRSRFLVWLLVLQGTGEERSANHAVVRPHETDYNPDVYPTMYLWKGFLEFCCYESNRICEYDYCLFPEHAIHWDSKQSKIFLLLVEMLTMFILLFILPKSMDLIHWFLTVCVHARVSKNDVNYGVSLYLP